MDPLKGFYLDHLRSVCVHTENPTSLVEEKSLDEHAYFVCQRLSQKGRLLWNQINCLLCYSWNLCEMYDFACSLERTLKNNFPTYVSLMILLSYLLMPRVFIVTIISKK